jgi:hypothetical protein
VCIVCLAAVSLAGLSPAIAQAVTLFETRVHGFNQGNRNLDVHVFNGDGSDAGYYHDLQCSIVYWANGDTTFPFELTYDPATRQVTWVVGTPDSGALTTTSPTAPPASPVNNLHLYVRATAGAAVSTCNAVPYQYCRAGGWDCNVQAQVDSSAVYLTDLELNGAPLAGLSASADLGNPTPLEAVDVPVSTSQPWTLTGNVRFTWNSANGYPPKETRIIFGAAGQRVPSVCTDEDVDNYSVETEGCGPIDCDDSDRNTYPGAPEICDGVDNQCPGDAGYDQVDEGCSPVCTDADGDGFSIEGGECGPVDCNDGAPKIHPGAPEICDGLDNQCPGDAGYGQVDEGCASTCAGSAEASTLGSPVHGASDLGKRLGLFLLPVGALIVLRIRGRRR